MNVVNDMIFYFSTMLREHTISWILSTAFDLLRIQYIFFVSLLYLCQVFFCVFLVGRKLCTIYNGWGVLQASIATCRLCIVVAVLEIIFVYLIYINNI